MTEPPGEPQRNAAPAGDAIAVGQVSGVFGVRGWIRVYSHTRPREHIARYSPWLVDTGGASLSLEVEAGRRHGKGVVAKLRGIDDRNAAAGLLGGRVAIARQQLEPLGRDEFYWADLIGLKVINPAGVEFGVVGSLLETGAHDVLVVQGEREHLVPFVRERIVKSIDLARGRITVDWEADY